MNAQLQLQVEVPGMLAGLAVAISQHLAWHCGAVTPMAWGQQLQPESRHQLLRLLHAVATAVGLSAMGM